MKTIRNILDKIGRKIENFWRLSPERDKVIKSKRYGSYQI